MTLQDLITIWLPEQNLKWEIYDNYIQLDSHTGPVIYIFNDGSAYCSTPFVSYPILNDESRWYSMGLLLSTDRDFFNKLHNILKELQELYEYETKSI